MKFLGACAGIAFTITTAIMTFVTESQYIQFKPVSLVNMPDGDWIFFCRVGLLIFFRDYPKVCVNLLHGVE